ncbi:MAG: site-specific DNA-methyltransferase [Armatimonadetes bacterium]|nr:site-specific DNA-methyltransferase [Armatimonadota bacterium]
MPTLDWIGKRAVVNHHQHVPTRLLHTDDGTPVGGGNLLVEGDNLLALKALLPYYAGQVKCIYIDPPYNTGNEGWVYNDAVNAPEIRCWLGQTVGKEADDLSRHDKWLCMMYPRLQLLRQLLRKDGLIFISIDDREVANLRLVMDEIFGRINFVGSLIWKRRQNVDSRAINGLSVDHEYLLTYSATCEGRLRGQAKDLTKYTNPNNDPRGAWASDNLVGLATKEQRPNLHYELVNPATGIPYPCPEAGWRYSKETMARLIAENRIIWPPKPTGRPRFRRYQNDLTDEFTGQSSVLNTVFNTQATLELKQMFDGSDVFDFPKPVDLIKLIVQQGTSSNSSDVVLDVFSGSGTTGHAVMQLNAEDGGNRRFLLVEMEPHIARDITAERLRRVINGYGDKPGLGGTFAYATLGDPLMDADGQLGAGVTYADLARFIFHKETGQTLADAPDGRGDGFLGERNGVAYYLLWGKGAERVLDVDAVRRLAARPGLKTVYADACPVAADRLARANVRFVQTQYALGR